MNQVYQAAKFILPQARFAAVKQEQIEWLKKRDAAGSIGEKCKFDGSENQSVTRSALVMFNPTRFSRAAS